MLLMGPNATVKAAEYVGKFDLLLEEPTVETLAEKLTTAVNSLPPEIELVGWIGDDDQLKPGMMKRLQSLFEHNADLVLAFGSCEYIDGVGNKLGVNRSGPWALILARLGPFLAPQPGSLFSRKAFDSIGGLDSNFQLAFDFDLFLALSSIGPTKYVPETLASFRWHSESLSVRNRKQSVKEASAVRLKHASPFLRALLLVTNPFVELLTRIAGMLVSRRLVARLDRSKGSD